MPRSIVSIAFRTSQSHAAGSVWLGRGDLYRRHGRAKSGRQNGGNIRSGQRWLRCYAGQGRGAKIPEYSVRKGGPLCGGGDLFRRLRPAGGNRRKSTTARMQSTCANSRRRLRIISAKGHPSGGIEFAKTGYGPRFTRVYSGGSARGWALTTLPLVYPRIQGPGKPRPGPCSGNGLPECTGGHERGLIKHCRG